MPATLLWDICGELHAMTDVGTAPGSRIGDIKYSRPHTNNAECYATSCRRRGRCLIAKDGNANAITKATPIR